MDMIGKIRRMHRRDKKTKRQISRETGLSRNTVAKWLDEVQPVEPKYRREAAKATKLSAYEAELMQSLKADARRPKKEGRTAKALFAQIKAKGYEGGYPMPAAPASTCRDGWWCCARWSWPRVRRAGAGASSRRSGTRWCACTRSMGLWPRRALRW